jgi:hypothetical protein
MNRYRFGGLTFASTIELPEWSVFREDDGTGEPDVVIAKGAVTETPGVLPQPIVRPGLYQFHARDAGCYRVSNGTSVDIHPFAEAGDREIRLFLLGTAIAAVFYQRGLLMLHASVVDLGDEAVVLCGQPGAGKSTTAAALVAGGGTFVCDDLGRVEVHAGRAWAYPSIPRLKLHAEALAMLHPDRAGFERDHYRANKFHVPQTHAAAGTAVPIRGVYLLEWTDTGPDIERLSGLEALQGLVHAATYRPAVLEPMNRLGSYWQQCAAVAATTRVWRVRRPRAWSRLEALVAGIRRTHASNSVDVDRQHT